MGLVNQCLIKTILGQLLPQIMRATLLPDNEITRFQENSSELNSRRN